MRAKKIQLDAGSTQLLKTLRLRTGLTRQYLCRLGFCLSLAEPGVVDPGAYDEEGLEFNRYTLMGEWDSLLVAYLNEWLLEEQHSRKYDDAAWFRAHINRGLSILPRRIRTLADVGELANSA